MAVSPGITSENNKIIAATTFHLLNLTKNTKIRMMPLFRYTEPIVYSYIYKNPSVHGNTL